MVSRRLERECAKRRMGNEEIDWEMDDRRVRSVLSPWPSLSDKAAFTEQRAELGVDNTRL